MAQLSALYELSTAYLACRDVDSLLKTFAAQLGKSLGARAVLVWMGAEGEALRSGARWFEPGERFETVSEPVVEGLLVEMQKARGARRLPRNEVDAEVYQHLTETHRERVQSALYAPISISTGVAGVLEVLNKNSGEVTADDAALAEEAGRITGRLLDSLQAAERDQLGNLATVQRLTELYDISRIFNSTIELQELLPIVAEKILELCSGQACNIWLVDQVAHDLYFAQ